MLRECVEGLNIDPDGIYVDCTLGGAGHSLEIAKRLNRGRLFAFDLDPEAIAFGKEKLNNYADKVTFVNCDFKRMNEVLSENGINSVNGILMDLGISSPQIDTPERGFSYMHDAPLDMRMDTNQSFSAYDVVNGYPVEKLTKIFRDYGEEKNAYAIARDIVKRRESEALKTTGELVKIISAHYPAFGRSGHPAKRVFQAIRIEVNGELDGLDKAVTAGAKTLVKGGRIAVITFHSLEDRIVKNAFRELEKDCICPKNLPVCVCGKRKEIEILTKKPITASAEELEAAGRASILIPSPNVAENHQYHNGMVLVKNDAAVLIEEKNLTGEKLCQTVQELAEDRSRLRTLGQNAQRLAMIDANERIYQELMRLLREETNQ